MYTTLLKTGVLLQARFSCSSGLVGTRPRHFLLLHRPRYLGLCTYKYTTVHPCRLLSWAVCIMMGVVMISLVCKTPLPCQKEEYSSFICQSMEAAGN